MTPPRNLHPDRRAGTQADDGPRPLSNLRLGGRERPRSPGTRGAVREPRPSNGALKADDVCELPRALR